MNVSLGVNAVPQEVRLAGFGRRLIALIFDDVLILGTFLVSMNAFLSPDANYWLGYLIGLFIFITIPLIALAWGLIFALLEWAFGGQTVGKALAGVAVRDAHDYGRVPLGRLLHRELNRSVLGILFFVPLLLDGLAALKNENRQTGHDRAADTVVVQTRDSPLGAALAFVILAALAVWSRGF